MLMYSRTPVRRSSESGTPLCENFLRQRQPSVIRRWGFQLRRTGVRRYIIPFHAELEFGGTSPWWLTALYSRTPVRRSSESGTPLCENFLRQRQPSVIRRWGFQLRRTGVRRYIIPFHAELEFGGTSSWWLTALYSRTLFGDRVNREPRWVESFLRQRQPPVIRRRSFQFRRTGVRRYITHRIISTILIQCALYQPLIRQIRNGNPQHRIRFHRSFGCKYSAFVPRPGAAGNAVVHIPVQHGF